ncbi:MAG: GNAT family N-acetyltransferase [Pseudomonadota bacterium]
MAPLTLRRATEDDFAPLTMLWAEGWDAGHAKIAPEELVRLRTAASFHTRLRGYGDDLLVCGERGAPTGFVVLKPDKIDQFYVHPKQVGTGLAARLMAATQDALRARGTTTAHLECLADNLRGCAFYKKLGWQERGMEDIVVDTSKGPFKMTAMIFEKRL